MATSPSTTDNLARQGRTVSQGPGQTPGQTPGQAPGQSSGKNFGRSAASSAPFPLLASVGFGLYLGWGMVSASPSLLDPAIGPAADLATMGAPLLRTLWLGILIAAAVASQILRSAESLRKPLALIAGICTFAGTAGIYIVVCLGAGDETLLRVARGLLAPSSLFIALWGERICMYEEQCAFRYTLVSSVVSFGTAFVAILLPGVLQAVLHCACPLASMAALLCSKPLPVPRAPFPKATPTRESGISSLARRYGFLAKALVGLCLLYAVVILLQSFSEGKTSYPNELLWLVAGIAVSAVLLALSFALGQRLRTTSLSKMVLPLFLVAVFVVFATEFEQRDVEVLAVASAWIYLRLFTWLIWRAAALRSDAVPFVVVGLGQVAITLGSTLGSFLYGACLGNGTPAIVSIAVVCLLSAIAQAFFLDTSSVARITDTDAKRLFDPADAAMCEACVDKATQLYGLSSRERAICLELIRGVENEAISDNLSIAYNTLRTHLRNLYKKTGTHSREELVLLLRSLA